MLATKIVDHSVKSLTSEPVVKNYDKALKMMQAGELDLLDVDVKGRNATEMQHYVAEHVRKVLNSDDVKDAYKIAEIGKQLSAGKSVQPVVALAAKHHRSKLDCEARQYVYTKRIFKVYTSFAFAKHSKLKNLFDEAMGFLFDNEHPYTFIHRRKHLYHVLGNGNREEFFRMTDKALKRYCDPPPPLEYRTVRLEDIISVITMGAIAFLGCAVVLSVECLFKLCQNGYLQIEAFIMKIITISNRSYLLNEEGSHKQIE